MTSPARVVTARESVSKAWIPRLIDLILMAGNKMVDVFFSSTFSPESTGCICGAGNSFRNCCQDKALKLKHFTNMCDWHPGWSSDWSGRIFIVHDMQRGTFSNLCSQMQQWWWLPQKRVVWTTASVQFNVMNQDAANVRATPPPSLLRSLVYFLAFQLGAWIPYQLSK